MEIRFTLSELLRFLRERNLLDQAIGQDTGPEIVMTGFSSIFETRPHTLTWMKAQSLDWTAIKASVIICSRDAKRPDDSGLLFIPVENPRNTFATVMRAFYPKPLLTGISRTAIIGDNCEIGADVYLGHHVVLGNGVKIGKYTQIHSNVTIYDNVEIGSHCVIHSGVVIGADGFGYEQDIDGHSFKFPHIGGVVIEDHVEIGCNSCVARGVLANTVIQEHVKIGNLTHISHNVVIGANAMITHQAHISGSNTVGSSSWIAPGAVLKEGLTVGNDSVVGLGAVVIKNVEPFDVVAGVPAASLKKKQRIPLQETEEENGSEH
ncbi:MAG: hypothetical protein K0R47_1850 [Brevibacillus sp.]|nr:hypothetical protein [Brevibacillus sp.]